MNTEPRFDFDLLPAPALKIVEKLRSRNMPFWIVGGFVREWAAGLHATRDVDIFVSAQLYPLAKLLQGEPVVCRVPFVKCGDVDVVPGSGILQSLRERDFTVNAMALDQEGFLIDPHGGMADARNHILRRVHGVSFFADPVRMLRACRLAGRPGWSIEAGTAASLRKHARRSKPDYMYRAHGVRLALELHKALTQASPSLYFRLCADFRLLNYALPPLRKYFEEFHGPELENLLSECDSCQPDPGLRLGIIARHIIRDRKKVGRGAIASLADYLRLTKWNLVASNFGRNRNYLRSGALPLLREMERIEDLDLPRTADLARKAHASGIRLEEWLSAAAYLRMDSSEGSAARIRGFLFEIARTDENPHNRRAALFFAGFGKKRISLLLNDQELLAEYARRDSC